MSGTEKRIRDRMLTVRLSPDERAEVEAKAERAGLMVGSFARQALIDAPLPRQVRRPAAERKELVRILGELGHIGGNLNQIAKSLNTGVLVYEAEIEAGISALRSMRDAVLAALGRET